MPLLGKRHERAPAEPGRTGPVIASAALVSQQQLATAVRRTSDWQTDAWNMYDQVSELRYGVGWLSSALSRARLYVAATGDVDDDTTSDPDPVENTRVNAPLRELFDGRSGQSQMLARMAIHLSIPGETYLIGVDIDGQRRWLTASNDEFTVNRGRTQIRLPETDQLIDVDPSQAVVIRLWRPHPKRANWADSPTRGLLPVLKELQGLTSHIRASVDSRLAGAGMLILPESASLPAPQQSDGANPVHSDPWTSALIESMITPLQDHDSAAAVVPIVAKVPDEAVGKIQHLSFATDLSEKAADMRDRAIRRVGLGMDIPPEVLLGLGDTNHWCVDAATEALTEHGWMQYFQLTPGDHVLTLDHATGMPEWRPVQQVNTWHVEGEWMLRINHHRHSSLTTLNHRWPVVRHSGPVKHRRIVTSLELTDGDWIPSLGEHTPVGECETPLQRYTGTIWCPEVTNGTWFARRDGTEYFTGNSAWQIEESAVKLSVRPLLTLICDAITEQYYRPALSAMRVRDPERYMIWPDTSELEQRPNRGPETIELYDRGLVGAETVRQEHGFSEEDAPDEAEHDRQMALKLIELAPKLAPVLLPILDVTDEATARELLQDQQPTQPQRQQQEEAPEGAGEQRPELPEGGPDQTEPPSSGTTAAVLTGADSWLVTALDIAVHRALERAGHWLLNRKSRSYRGQLRDVPSHEIHTHISAPASQHNQMLAGAYRELHQAAPDSECLHETVDWYVRALLESGQKHQRHYLVAALAQSGCDQNAA